MTGPPRCNIAVFSTIKLLTSLNPIYLINTMEFIPIILHLYYYSTAYNYTGNDLDGLHPISTERKGEG